MKLHWRVVTVLMVTAVLFSAWLVTTSSGLQFISAALNKQTDNLQFESITGRLTGPLSVSGLEVDTPQGNVFVKTASIDWSLTLFSGAALTIDPLTVDGVTIRVTDSREPVTTPTDSAPFVLPEKISPPLKIKLSSAKVTNITIHVSGESEPIIVDSITLDVNVSPSGRIRTALDVQSPLLTVDSDLTTQASNDYSLDGKINWSVRLPDIATVSSKTTLSGSLQKLDIQHTTAPPYNVSMQAIVENIISAPSFTTEMNIAIGDLSEVKPSLQSLNLNASVTARGTPAEADFELTSEILDAVEETIKIDGSAQLRESSLMLNDFTIALADTKTQLVANGVIALKDPELPLNVTVLWQELQWPLTGLADVQSANGKLEVSGTLNALRAQWRAGFGVNGRITGKTDLDELRTFKGKTTWTDLSWPHNGSTIKSSNGQFDLNGSIDSYLFQLKTNIESPQAGVVKVIASGDGTSQNIDASTIFVTALEGELSGAASAALSPNLTFRVSLDGKNINPQQVLEDFPGTLSMSLRAQGAIDSTGNLNATIDPISVTGELREYPLNFNAVAEGGVDQIVVKNLSLESGSTNVQLQGTIGEIVDINWTVNSPELGSVLPEASGSVTSTGQVSGALRSPSVHAELIGSDIRYSDYTIDDLSLNSNIELQEQGDIELIMLIKNLQSPGLIIAKSTLKATGAIDDHVVSFNTSSNRGDITLGLIGGYRDHTWAANLTDAILAPVELGTWELQKTSRLTVSREISSIDQLCLESGNASLCTTARIDASSKALEYKLDGFNLAYLKSLFPSDTVIGGTVTSTGNIILDNNGTPKGTVQADLKNTEAFVTASNGAVVSVLKNSNSRLQAIFDDKQTNATLAFDLGSQGRLDGRITSYGAPAQWLKNELRGELTGDVSDLAFVSALVPEIIELQGKLASDIRISGTGQAPRIQGGIAFEEGELELDSAGITVQGIEAAITASDNNTLLIDSLAQSHRGNLAVTGTVAFNAARPTVNLDITGTDFLIVDTLEARAVISPNVKIRYAEVLDLSGKVVVPELSITPKSTPQGAVTVSTDQVIVDSSNGDTQVATPVNTSINIVLGDKVTVDAFGLKARLDGDVRVSQNTTAIYPLATGQLEIFDGTFKAYGQNLKIQKGRIIYTGGPVSKPGLDFEAVRDITTNLQVGVRVRGSAEEPAFSLFSTPSMTETEQLSYLVLGRPIDDNTPTEQSAMKRAAVALGLAGGQLLTGKLESKLGLDQLAIDSELREDGEQAALIIGKYLSPKLFVSYGIGLFEPVSTLRLNYSVNRNIKLVTETTESRSGGDVIFTFESGNK